MQKPEFCSNSGFCYLGARVRISVVGCGCGDPELLVVGGGTKTHTKLTIMLSTSKIAKIPKMICVRRCARCRDRLAIFNSFSGKCAAIIP
jgi:hypothetical protein